ncbi:MAG: Hsp20/alpha crystallin family protein [Brevinematales bacterium]|jgi:HSP20 family protein
MKILQRDRNVPGTGLRPRGDAFSELFRHFFDDEYFENDWNPRVDVFEKDDKIMVKADLPGVDEKNLDIEIEGSYLTIKGSKGEDHEEEVEGYRRIERTRGSFSRTIALPEHIDQDKIDAEYKNGVLSLTIPKSPESVTKKINVKVA